MVYAVQKLLFWAGAIRFIENDELNYWKKRKREIAPEFEEEQALLEQVDFALAEHFAKHLTLVPEVLVSIFQGGDSFEYAQKIVARVQSADDEDDPS